LGLLPPVARSKMFINLKIDVHSFGFDEITMKRLIDDNKFSSSFFFLYLFFFFSFLFLLPLQFKEKLDSYDHFNDLGV